MSSIYIQEPPTSGKVLLKTSVGDIDIELWARECPKACRNFVQLCMEGYYNSTIFHRVVKGFIAQGGDPSGDGSGGESIYGEPFKDEFHSRLRFSRRGLVAMANSDKDDNSSQFFFTMGATPELQNKHTLFGKVTGDTVFNMLKLEEGLVDHNERPLYPPKILGAEILSNPFDDIVPRDLKKDEKKEKKRNKEKGVKNFGLLSFGEEAEEDEEETNHFVQKNAGKAKSTHDVLDDPLLSKDSLEIQRTKGESDIEDYEQSGNDEDAREKAERIKNKLSSKKSKKEKQIEKKDEDGSDDDDDYFKTVEREKKEKRDKKAEEIRQEIVSLKKEYKKERKVKDDLIDKQLEQDAEKETSNELVKEYITEKNKYSHLKKKTDQKKGKGSSREDFTLALLSKFRNKLDTLKEKTTDKESVNHDDNVIEEEIKGDDWLSHKLNFEDSKAAVLAKDASTKSDDWYDVFDPRNPLNKRKRGEVRSQEDHSKKNKTR